MKQDAFIFLAFYTPDSFAGRWLALCLHMRTFSERKWRHVVGENDVHDIL